MHAQILYNDQLLPCDQKILLPGQLGLLAGWGVFTTLRIYDGVPFEFDRHWKRMSRDAALLHVPFRWEGSQVRAQLLRLIHANQAENSTMRVCIVRSEGGFWEGPGSGHPSDLIAFTNDLARWQDSVALGVAAQARHAASRFAGTKTLSWSHNLTLLESANQEGFAEVILLNEHGDVAECTATNIFAVKDGTISTPPLASGCLPGVTRAVLLDEVKLEDSPVVERTLKLDDLYAADEVFITSTTRELLPVHQIGDRRIADDGPNAWPVVEKLESALQGYIRRYVEKAKRAAA